jgi:diphosphomevalonate decarboxylase
VSPVVWCRAHPSLALIKYWGKRDPRRNLPATPSLAVTLGGVHTETRVSLAESDSVTLGGVLQPATRYEEFFAVLRRLLAVGLHFRAESLNSFPTAAGLASSSSGFAALAAACVRAAGRELTPRALSALARVGSASAARSLFEGFTLLAAGAAAARPLYPASHWPELRIVVALASGEAKPMSSRQAMEATRRSSPFYRVWLRSAGLLLPEALAALARRDLERLGEAARLSYTRMHAALLASEPPVLYWLPGTVALIRECAALRRRGVGAWETIDAGPQVKVLCLEAEAAAVADALRAAAPGVETIVCHPGPGPEVRVLEG